jgi:hypothetical protein
VGTTVQVEQDRWAYLDARLFVAGTASSSILARDVQLAYKKYGAFTFVAKPLNGAQTELAAGADFGDTTIQLTNSAIFPRTAGTLIINPGVGVEIIDFTSNDLAGNLNIPSGIQTAGAPAFAAGTTVQFSYATTLIYNVLAGATSIVVADSAIFPPGFGKVKIYNSSVSEEVEITSNVTSGGGLSFSTALVNPYTAGDRVELIEWYELTSGPDGYYSILFTPEELDTREQFLYTLRRFAGPPAPGAAIDEFERTIDIIRATTGGTEPAPSLATCVIKDHILNLSGSPLQNTGVSARLLALPTIMSSVGVYDEIVSTKTDANGFFQLTLIQGATVDIVIPSTGYRRTIVVPSTTSANLFEI